MIPLTATTCFLIAVTFLALVLILLDHLRSKKTTKNVILDDNVLPEPPGPKPWPILGSLHILGRYDVPYKAFADLVRDYDCQVIKLRMGSVPCVVVNGLENIREVLTIKGHHFDSRPNFTRYHLLFGGNKENCKNISFILSFLYLLHFDFDTTKILLVVRKFCQDRALSFFFKIFQFVLPLFLMNKFFHQQENFRREKNFTFFINL